MKWYGKVGYATCVEGTGENRGIYTDTIVEKEYYGDAINCHWKRQNSGNINDDITVSQSISIVADPFAIQHCSEIIYVEHLGTKWKVTDVEPLFPRLQLSIGGVYNGESPGSST